MGKGKDVFLVSGLANCPRYKLVPWLVVDHARNRKTYSTLIMFLLHIPHNLIPFIDRNLLPYNP